MGIKTLLLVNLALLLKQHPASHRFLPDIRFKLEHSCSASVVFY